MKQPFAIAVFTTILFVAVSTVVRADVLFEGYSKVVSGKDSIGYIVQRYEFDKAKHQFTTISFTHLGPKSGNSAESMKAVCNDKFEPISFSYTLKSPDKTKTIDGSFAKGMMTLKMSDGGKTQTKKVKLEKGTFLSSFLGYLMLQNGYKVGKKFQYSAIAEEDGTVETGHAFIEKDDKYHDRPAFKILNEFKDAQFTSWVTARGEILATESKAQGIGTELVKDPKEATKDQLVPNSTLSLLFGKVPDGKANVLNTSTTATSSSSPEKKNDG
jgi:hypothetical protein